jgi:hypothetical protein
MEKMSAGQGRQSDFTSRSVTLTVALPGNLAAALDGECRRTLSTRTEAVRDLLAFALVARLAEDLAHPNADAVVDAGSQEAPAPRPRLRQRSSLSTPPSPPPKQFRQHLEGSH